MSDILVMQGRELRSEDIALIHGLLDENPKWGRTRTRNDRENSIRVSVKDVYLYPLAKNFKEALCHDHA
ncbi:MAG: hypothetical protein M0P27_08495 [Bacteroidales bacterium]|nr:hypothetical protein [Bacteroidales bacterium]